MNTWTLIQLIFVLLLPGLVKSDDVTCFTYNYDEYLQCYWNSTKDESTSNVTVTWSLIFGHLVSSSFDCPILTQSFCRWDMTLGDLDPHCVIDVCVSLFNTCQEVRCQETVKLPPVEDIAVTNTTPSCVSLQWFHGQEYLRILYPKLYHVVFIPLSGGNQQEFERSWTISETKLDACGLIPYTKYLIKIAALPLEGGIWSDNRSVTVTTTKAAPGLPPIVKSNSFTVFPRGRDEYRDIMIFWQDIRKQRIYGSHLQYLVSICPLVKSRKLKNCTMETELSSVRFKVPAQQEVTARIWSQNEIGISRDFAVIKIPTEDQLLPPPAVVVSTNETSTVLYWKAAHPHEHNRFTVYWCHDDYKYLHLLQGLQNTTITRNHDRVSFLKYGVSVVHNKKTSGIKWATCVIRNNKFPRPPEVTLTLLKQTHINIIWRMPRCNMHLLSKFGAKFVLTICNTPNCTTKKMVKMAADVTSYIYTIIQEDTFCAKIEVDIGGKSQTNDIQCLELKNTFHLHIAAISVVVVLCLLPLAALLGKTIIK
ncbi:uncharacterized protein LOC133176775 [Saccostrea echinata]|uniref:uncharacterized protein LOC133176775 n=1 Tax=Saccostrea echinata TaxID=191078 RepID=UPI002A841AE4|nr:uncharacterized protein LOC133176775 [Saccostrea echinata]